MSTRQLLDSTRARPFEKAKGEEQGFQGTTLLHFPVLRMFSNPKGTKLSFEQHRSLYLAKTSATRRTGSRTCRSGCTRSPALWSEGIVIRRCCGTEAIVWWRGQRPHSWLGTRIPAATGGDIMSCMFLDTVASKDFAVRRRRVSPTATGRWLPSFFSAMSGALAIQEPRPRCRPRCGGPPNIIQVTWMSPALVCCGRVLRPSLARRKRGRLEPRTEKDRGEGDKVSPHLPPEVVGNSLAYPWRLIRSWRPKVRRDQRNKPWKVGPLSPSSLMWK